MQFTIKTPYIISEAGQESTNQDSLYPNIELLTTNNRLFILSDGMKDGRVAQIITTNFHDYLTKVNPPKKQQLGQLYMNEALRYVERRVSNYLRSNRDVQQGSGGTVALLYLGEDGSVSIAWVGNSRVYHIRKKQILYKTDDHLTNIWVRNERQVVSRTISGTEPVWISVALLDDVQPNDYFFICTQGISETLGERNIKYLFSQTDGSNATNAALMDKIKSLCQQNSYSNYSAYCIQIQSTPTAGTIAAASPLDEINAQKAATIVAPKINTSTYKKPKPQPVQNRDKITYPSYKTKSNNTIGSSSRTTSNLGKYARLLAAVVLLFLLGTLVFTYTTSRANPKELFETHLQKSDAFIQEANFTQAIHELEKALKVDIGDEDAQKQARQKLQKTKEQFFIQKADRFYSANKLVRAKDHYEQALMLNTKNNSVRRKIDDINLAIEAEKADLLVAADSLLRVKSFDEAKKTLYSALYLDQQNSAVLELINLCNLQLSEESISLNQALNEAIALVDPLDPAIVNQGPFPYDYGELAIVEEPVETSIDTTELFAENIDTQQVRTKPVEAAPSTPKPQKPKMTIMPTTPAHSVARPTTFTRPTRPSSVVNPAYTQLLKEADNAYAKGEYLVAKAKYQTLYEMQPSHRVKQRVKDADSRLQQQRKKQQEAQARLQAALDKAKKEAEEQAKLAAQERSEREAKEQAAKLAAAAKAQKEALKREKEREYQSVIAKADAAFQQGRYEEAKAQYQKALDYEQDNGYATRKIKDCVGQLAEVAKQKAFKEELAQANQTFQAGNYALARQQYQSLLSSAPGGKRASIQSKIADCNKQIDELAESSPKRKVKKAQRYCKSKGYKQECYIHLKEKGLFYSVDANTLYQLGLQLESVDATRAKECFTSAANKGSQAAKDKLGE